MTKIKTRKSFEVLKLNLTIQSDENNKIFDININDGCKSVSYDDIPTLKEIIEIFDY